MESIKINRSNYEPFLIDYLDGSLSREDQASVEAFLLMHADIQLEFEELSKCFLPEDHLNFDFKAAIKVHDELPRSTHLMLRSLDGPLTINEKVELESLLSHPQIAHEYGLLQKTFLKPIDDVGQAFDPLKFPESLTPAQEVELEAMNELPILVATGDIFPKKEDLKFDGVINFDNPLMMAAACAEGDVLDASAFIGAHPDYAAVVVDLRKMRLEPMDLVFEEKSRLKRNETPVIFFTPMVKRTVAVAAVFLLGIMIWKPWDQRGNLPVEVAQQMDVNRPAEQAEETMDKNATMAESNSMEQNDGDSVVRPIRVIVSPKNQMNDIAFSLPETQNKDVEQEEEQLELPILEIPEELAEQTPEVAPLKPYTPIAKEATMNAGSAKEPLTVLAFIGDKIENRFEQSAVYTYLDKKRKAIFDAADDSESVRYERISTPNGVRQKLVLWGLEFQRSKRAR